MVKSNFHLLTNFSPLIMYTCITKITRFNSRLQPIFIMSLFFTIHVSTSIKKDSPHVHKEVAFYLNCNITKTTVRNGESNIIRVHSPALRVDTLTVIKPLRKGAFRPCPLLCMK